MSYRVPFANTFIECDTALEALSLADAAGMSGEFIQGNTLPHYGPWTAILLDTFLGKLGPDQKAILSILVTKTRVDAEDLRIAVNVKNNQALAGIISGISKQAAAMNIGARDVFGIENRRRSGVLSKTFFAADSLLRVARATGWPSAVPKTLDNASSI
jgi:hypothetical protein